jgi:hypothetical protein
MVMIYIMQSVVWSHVTHIFLLFLLLLQAAFAWGKLNKRPVRVAVLSHLLRVCHGEVLLNLEYLISISATLSLLQ